MSRPDLLLLHRHQGRYLSAGWAWQRRRRPPKEGEWNTLRVRAFGDRFEVWLNGTKTTDYTNAAYPGAAPIGLQVHPGLAMSVQFKDIVVKSAYGDSGSNYLDPNEQQVLRIRQLEVKYFHS
jgi:hypothetical protein